MSFRQALIAAAVLLPLQAHAQWPGRIEIIGVASQTQSGAEFLHPTGPAKDVMLGGELRLPVNAAPKSPVVILVHGSGGIGAGPDYWARTLNQAGIAAFILDSFSGRNIVSTVEDQEQLNSLAMMTDAYRALDVLAKHPRIDASRIAVMGFSKGAVASVYSAMERFRAAHGSGARFAAHVGFYTPCNVAYEGDTTVSPVPIRLYHGAADDYVNPAACRDYVERLKAAKVDVTLTEYPNGQHGFDSPTSPTVLAVPKAQSTRNCRLREGPDGTILNAATGQPYALATDPCVAIGAHVGHDQPATDAAREAVLAFFKAVLQR